jgi:UDP-N-acetylmuramyl pentapeptide phosphotransferase/UDP-N-acetylglucosamine-1-phosphate transferase
MIITIIGTYVVLAINKQFEVANRLIPMTILLLGFGLIGFIDDFKKLVLKNTKGLKPSYKMLGLLIISVAYVMFLVKGLNLGTTLVQNTEVVSDLLISIVT